MAEGDLGQPGGEMEADGLYRCRHGIGLHSNYRINLFPPNEIGQRSDERPSRPRGKQSRVYYTASVQYGPPAGVSSA